MTAINNKKKPRVFAHNETNFNHNGFGILYDADEVLVSTNLDGERKLTFNLDFNSPNWGLIRHGLLVLVEGQLYRITLFNRRNDGDEISSVTCFHVFSDSAFATIRQFPREGDSADNTVRGHLESAFRGSRFHVMTEQEVAAKGMKWVQDYIFLDQMADTSAGDVLSQCMTSIEKGELYIDNWSIAVVDRVGRNKGVKISDTVNSEAVSEESDFSEVINVIYVTGKNGLALPSTYPDSIIRSEESIARFGEREGYLNFDNIEDPVKLLAEAEYAISPTNHERVDMPKTSITITYIDMSKMYAYYPSLGVGDTAFVPQHLSTEGMGEVRITQIDYYPLSPENSSITVGTPPRTLTDYIGSAVRSGRQFGKVTDERGKIKASWLTSIQQSMRTYVNARLKELQVELHETGDVWVDPQDPNRALAIFGGQLAIANKKTPEGDWAWTTFGDGDGFTADLINAGQLNAGLVKIADDEGYLNIFSSLIEMFSENTSDPDNPILRMQLGVDSKDNEFKFMVWNKQREPVMYLDANGEFYVKGRMEAPDILSTNLYAENGYVSLLTVDSLQTSDFVQRYNLRDRSPVHYIQAEDQYLDFMTAEVETGVAKQLTNRLGQLVYWEIDPNGDGVTMDENGVLYNADNKRVLTTTADTGFPVMIYKYKYIRKMRQGFSEQGIPSIVWGYGTTGDPDNPEGQLRIEKTSTSGDISYTTTTGIERKISIGETGISVENEGDLFEGIRTDKDKPFILEVRRADPVNAEIGRMWLIDEND